MKEAYFFKDTKIEYSEYLKIIEEKMTSVNIEKIYIAFPKSVDALIQISDDEKKDKLLDVSIAIDRSLTQPHSKNGNTKRKLLAMATAANLIVNYYDEIKDLNDKQIAVLGHYFHDYCDEEIDNYLHIFANRELLDSVIKKTKDNEWQYHILTMVKDQCPNECCVKGNILETNDFRKQMIDVIGTKTLGEIMDMQKSSNEITSNMETEGFII